MNHQISIRAHTMDDLDALLQLYTHLHDEAPQERYRSEVVYNQIMNTPGMILWGLFVGSTLVASCVVNIIPNLTRGARAYALIENVVTHRDYRKRGYGKQILKAAIQHARQENCYKIMLSTSSKDPGVWQFYEHCGFDGDHKRAFVKFLA